MLLSFLLYILWSCRKTISSLLNSFQTPFSFHFVQSKNSRIAIFKKKLISRSIISKIVFVLKMNLFVVCFFKTVLNVVELANTSIWCFFLFLIFYFFILLLFCATACQNNKYGTKCSKSCGRCVNGEQCNPVNGTCPNGCAAGYYQPRCKKSILAW